MKRVALLCFLSSLLLIALFHQAIFSFLTIRVFEIYAASLWGKSLEYDQAYVDGNQLVVLKPHLENGSSFNAERMTLTFHLDWVKRHLHVAIAVDQPHWHFQTPLSSQWENWQTILSREEKWIKIHPSFHIQQGSLSWVLPNQSQHQFHFDLEANSQEGGSISLYLDSLKEKRNCLTLQASGSADEMEVHCRCRQVECHSLMALIHLLGMDFSDWLVDSGSVDGELKAIFPAVERPYLEGDLLIEQLAFTQLATELKGNIEQAHLKIEKNQAAYESTEQVPTVIGQLDILKPATLTYDSPQHSWILYQIVGSIKLNNVETVLIALDAQGGAPCHPSQWSLQGTANLNAHRSLNLDLSLFCSSLGQPDGKIHLSLHQSQENCKRAEVQLKKLSYEEYDFLQALLATYWPVLNDVKLEKGELSATIEAEITSQGIDELQVKHFQASHVECYLKPSHTKCYFDKAKGHGKVNLANQDFWHTLQAELHLDNGEARLEGLSPPLPLTAIQAHLIIQQGHVEHSLVTLQLAGLKGVMDIEWGKTKQLLTCKLDGTVQDLAELLPDIIQDGVRKNFYDNRLVVLANIKRQAEQFELGGTLHIQRGQSDQVDLIHFGCELKKPGDEAEPKFIPMGWFYARQLPLEKFLSPFIFRRGTLQMRGEGELKGSFDGDLITIKYDAENLIIENENLCIEAKHLRSSVPGQLLGVHEIDLKTNHHRGTLPIRQAEYVEKNSGLIFKDIQGMVAFRDQTISIAPIEAYCEGVYFAGTLDLDYSDPAPGVFNLDIQCPAVSGKISQIQHLLAHLDYSSVLNKIPLEGEVATKEEGLKLSFAFIPQHYEFEAVFRGAVSDGSLAFESADMALKGIDMDVNYHHRNQDLEFTDIQGTLLVGKPRRVEEYLFAGHHIRFHQLDQPDINLDIAIKDRGEELFRLVGYTHEKGNGIKSFSLDPHLSHLSCIYPAVWQCDLKEVSSIDRLEFQSQFHLNQFFRDLHLFRQTGLLFLSPCCIERLAQFLPLEGHGAIHLSYQSDDQCLTYELEGTSIKQGALPKHYGLLKGRKLDKKWMIDHLQWDDWTLYAELLEVAGMWKIPFAGLKAGQSILLGLEGDFTPSEGLLRAKLNLCEIDLAGLNQWEALRPFVLKWQPKGFIRASGEMEWQCLDSSTFMEGLRAKLTLEPSELAFRNYPVHILTPYEMEFQAGRILSFRNIQLELFPHMSQALLKIRQLNYQFALDLFDCTQAAFQIPGSVLERLGQSLHDYFPDIFENAVKEILIEAKPSGPLQGALAFKKRTINSLFS